MPPTRQFLEIDYCLRLTRTLEENSPPLEALYLPNRDKVVAAARELLAYLRRPQWPLTL